MSFKNFNIKSASHTELSLVRKSAFTLSEIIVVLTLLAIIAALTIPGVLSTYKASVERTKLKKAITDFNKIVENMRVTENLISVGSQDTINDPLTLVGFASGNNCEKGRKYFKIKSGDNCVFQTNDGTTWDISDMSKPKISVDKNCGKALSSADEASITSSCENKLYDMAVDQGNAAKGYAFIVNDPEGDAKELLMAAGLIDEEEESYSDELRRNIKNGVYPSCDDNGFVRPCIFYACDDAESKCLTIKIFGAGGVLFLGHGCDRTGEYCSSAIIQKLDSKGNVVLYAQEYCKGKGSSDDCTKYIGYKYPSDDFKIMGENCNKNGEKCQPYTSYKKIDSSFTVTGENCDENGKSCETYTAVKSGTSKTAYTGTGCDENGEKCTKCFNVKNVEVTCP